MLFQAEILTPANTLASAPVITRVRVYPGIVTRVWAGFPQGCFGLAHMQVWHWGWQVWPWTPQTSFHWNDYMFSFEDRYPITVEPLEFVVKTWNLDDFYPHTLTFMVTVEPAPPLEELEALYRTLEELGISPEGIV